MRWSLSLFGVGYRLQGILPLHPRTETRIEEFAISTNGIHTIEPLSYSQMVSLQRKAKVVLTDSGGLQKEAYWMRTPCVTIRDETEWTELVDAGVNIVTGASRENIVQAVGKFLGEGFPINTSAELYGNAGASERIVERLVDWLSLGNATN